MNRPADGPPDLHRPAPDWYVAAQDRVWGPYPERRIADFVQEGRVAAATLLGIAPQGPFRPAVEQAALRRLFIADDPQRSSPEEAAPAAKVLAPTASARPLVVFAALHSLDQAAFEAALAIHGPAERVGQGLWLLRARMGPAALRNALSRRLRGGDTLVVVEAPLEQAAWFNLEEAEERRLRALWAG